MQVKPATVSSAAENMVKTGRLLSLDVFRGGTIAAMILVNNNGSEEAAYAPLVHAEWHGWTFTDLIFPSFLWIVGVAVTLSFAKRIERGDSRHRLMIHVLQRSALIFLIGVLLNGFPYYHLSTIRIPGVLQRIAICYLVASTIFLYAAPKARLIWTFGLMAVYWILMMAVPVPGCGAGSLTVDCNFARWIDGMFLSGHMWSATKVWDPEGLISTLPAVANTMFGIFAGQVLASRRQPAEKVSWLFVIGNVLVFAGMILATWMPINKKLWTDSFAFFTSGISTVVFAACYWLVDIQGWRRFVKPFAIYGMNALAVYILAGAFARLLGVIKLGDGTSLGTFVWRDLFEPLASPANASLAYSLAHVLLFLGVAWFMYRRNWIFRV